MSEPVRTPLFQTCGYDVSGTDADSTCPECGSPVSHNRSEQAQRTAAVRSSMHAAWTMSIVTLPFVTVSPPAAAVSSIIIIILVGLRAHRARMLGQLATDVRRMPWLVIAIGAMLLASSLAFSLEWLQSIGEG